MKTRNLTPEDVLAYIEDNRGTRFQISQLSRAFKVKPDAMRYIVKALAVTGLIRENRDGNTHRFYLWTAEEEAAQNRAPYRPPFKPLTGYTEKCRAFEAGCMATRK